jgi:hypothetical protein
MILKLRFSKNSLTTPFGKPTVIYRPADTARQRTPHYLPAKVSGWPIFDPFTGSGTTGIVALKLNRRFVGVELNPSDAQIAKDRLNGNSSR